MAWALTIRGKLVLFSLLILIVVSFGFTLLHLRLARAAVEEDLRQRAILFAREIAVTIGDRRELESGVLLERQIRQIMDVRQSVLQLDVLAFTRDGMRVVATSHPHTRLPFTRRDADQVRHGRVVSRLIERGDQRYWEVAAPITLEDGVAGGVSVRFSLGRADALAERIRLAALGATAASVLIMALLMSAAVHVVMNRPLRRFLEAIRRIQAGDTTVVVDVRTRDELGLLARHFNEMIVRIRDFNEELQNRVKEATHELEVRYREVERLNELLFAMQRRLSHAERLALSGRIMAEVAHEVGTPLHSVAGHLELLRQDLPAGLLTEDVRRRLGIIESQVTRVTEIIARLLDLTRRPAGEPTLVNVDEIVRDCTELVRPGVTAAGLTLELTSEAPAPPVRGDASQLQQVVLNLLTNAIDATPTGGSIRVATRRRGGQADVEIVVTDTGRGIPADRTAQIFEPFFSTKEPGHGTGLGLFITAQIVREHGGRIEIDSAEGRGATFRVFLPAAPA